MTSTMRGALVAAAVTAAAGVGAHAVAEGAKKGLADLAGISLENALERVAQDREARDGTIVEAELESEDGRLVYSIDVAIGTRILELQLDAGTGAIVKRESEDEDKSDLTQTKFGVAEAVRAALRAVPGKALSAEVARHKGGRTIEVTIEASGKKHVLVIDAETGTIGPVAHH
jgi:uncharacterized membrane protein YkoI